MITCGWLVGGWRREVEDSYTALLGWRKEGFLAIGPSRASSLSYAGELICHGAHFDSLHSLYKYIFYVVVPVGGSNTRLRSEHILPIKRPFAYRVHRRPSLSMSLPRGGHSRYVWCLL